VPVAVLADDVDGFDLVEVGGVPAAGNVLDAVLGTEDDAVVVVDVDDLGNHPHPASAAGELLKAAAAHLPLELTASGHQVDVGLDAAGLKARQRGHGDGLRDGLPVALVDLWVRDAGLTDGEGKAAGGLLDSLVRDDLRKKLGSKVDDVVSELGGG
jgi:hypothetical protein